MRGWRRTQPRSCCTINGVLHLVVAWARELEGSTALSAFVDELRQRADVVLSGNTQEVLSRAAQADATVICDMVGSANPSRSGLGPVRASTTTLTAADTTELHFDFSRGLVVRFGRQTGADMLESLADEVVLEAAKAARNRSQSISRLLAVVMNEGARKRWLSSPNIRLGGDTPLERIKAGQPEDVESLLLALAEGVPV